MIAERTIPRVSFEQFLGMLAISHVKLELLDGVAFAMAGGTFEHSRIANRIGTLLTNGLRGKPCVALQSDMLVKGTSEFAAFPDATVVCGEPVLVKHDKNPALTNPTLIVEILSEGTEEYDRGEKFERYKAIPSLLEYVLVSQDERRIEVFARATGWASTTATTGSVTLASLGITLDIDEIYFDPLRRGS